MPSTNWALRGLDTLGADLHLRQIIPWGAAGAVVPVSIASTFAPIQGGVVDLLDDTESECVFAAQDVRKPGFAIQFQFATEVDLRGFRFRKGQSEVRLNRHSVSMGEKSCTVGALKWGGDGVSVAPVAPLNFTSEALSWSAVMAAGSRAWVGCAAQGNFMVAGHYGGYVYFTRDGGETWAAVTAAGVRSWHGAAISADGQTAIATCADTGNKPWVTKDGGLTWAQVVTAPSGRWDVCAVSADGQVMLIAGGTGYAYMSKDGGATWEAQTAAGSRNWRGCAISGDGQTLLLADSASSGYGWLSKNGGLAWSAVTAAGSRPFRGCAVSGDGRILVLASDGGSAPLMLSLDGGASWGASTSGSGNWYDCAVSHNGSVIIGADYGNNRLVFSVNGGVSFDVADAGSRSWYACAVSADGAIGLGGVYPSGTLWSVYFSDAAYAKPEQAVSRIRLGAQLGLPPASSSFMEAIFAEQATDVEFGGTGCIYGTVELYAQAGNIPLPRRVRLHRSRDGMLVRETWSDAQGTYRFDGITERYNYDVIAWDHEGLQQSVVANDLTPEPMQ